VDVGRLDPADGAAIELATGFFIDLLCEASEHGRDVDVQVRFNGRMYKIELHVLAGDMVVVSRQVAVEAAMLAEEVRLRLLRLHVDMVLARAARFQRLMAMQKFR
jgi:hypothetical protein